MRKRVHGSGDGNGNTDMSNKNTDLTEDKVWGLQDGESNGYIVLDAHKVCKGRGGGTLPRTRSGGSRTEKVMDMSSLTHTRFIRGGDGGGEPSPRTRSGGPRTEKSNRYIVLDARKVCFGRGGGGGGGGGERPPRTRSGDCRREKVTDTSYLMHTRFVRGGSGGRPRRGQGRGLQEGESNRYIVLDAHNVCMA